MQTGPAAAYLNPSACLCNETEPPKMHYTKHKMTNGWLLWTIIIYLLILVVTSLSWNLTAFCLIEPFKQFDCLYYFNQLRLIVQVSRLKCPCQFEYLTIKPVIFVQFKRWSWLCLYAVGSFKLIWPCELLRPIKIDCAIYAV